MLPKFTLLILIAIGLIATTATQAQVTTAGSYQNTSRLSGGPVNTGDILQIRAVISVASGTSITGLRFTDNVPTGTNYVAGSLKAVTNEGVVVGAITNTGSYTDATGDDRGQVVVGAVTLFMGTGATSAAGGSITGGTTTPVFYTSASIIMAVYNVTVTAAAGSTITLAGTFRYNSSPTVTVNLPSRTILVGAPVGCGSSLLTNLVTDETGGTFSSGTTQNRTSSTSVTGFTYKSIATSSPNDAEYSIVKNTSPTEYTGAAPASSDKVFGVWDICGDHSGTATAAGNSASGSGTSGGYMLAVNASYAPAAVFTSTISGVSKNTNYTLSFWVRNICPNCGADPASNAGSGTPGVKPNLALSLNGSDLYSTGEITYSGTWVQKSFTFNSGASTSLVLVIKNNAPGGGGNDWVLDDIKLVQCVALLPLKLTNFTAALQSGGVEVSWTTSEESNMKSFVVQKSTDGRIFNNVNTVAPSNLSTGSSYSVIDKFPATVNYYRLCMTDKDGTTTFSEIRKISTAAATSTSMKVFPNPANSEVKLYINSNVSGSASIVVYDMNGIAVKQQTTFLTAGANQVQLNLNSLQQGTYVLKCASGSQFEATRIQVIH